MSVGLNNGATTIPAGGSQPVQLATPALVGSVLICNLTGNSTVYVGGSTVTSSTGVPILAGGYISLDVVDVGSVYLAGTQNDVVRWVTAARTNT